MKRLRIGSGLALVLLMCASATAGAQTIVSAGDFGDLVSKLAAAAPGQTVHLPAGEYVMTQPIVVPDGVTLEGEGVMTFDAAGLPAGHTPATRTTLRATGAVAGELVRLEDGASLARIAIEEFPNRGGGSPFLSGNPLVVSSRAANDSVSASIVECEIVNPNSSGVAFNGPSGRGLVVITRNPRELVPPAPHAGSFVAVSMSRSIIRSPAIGSGIFAINFAPTSHVSVALDRNVIGGGLDAGGGVSRPFTVTGSSTAIDSHHNLYRSDAPGTPASENGILLTGGGGPPVNIFTVGTTSDNELSMTSVDDRIEGFRVGVYVRGGVRSFGAPIAGPTNDCHAEVSLLGTTIVTQPKACTPPAAPGCTQPPRDLKLFGVESGSQTLIPGDGNTAHVVMRGVTGGHQRANFYFNGVGPITGLDPAFTGTGNELTFSGNANAFAHTNDFDEQPPAAFFSGQ